MDAKLTTAVGLPSRGLSERTNVVAAAVLVCGAALTSLALLVFFRRLAGALHRPAPVAVLVTSAVVVGLFAYLSRYVGRTAVHARASIQSRRRMEAAIAWVPPLSIVLLTFGLSWPLDRFIDWLVWTPVWIAEVLWRAKFLSGGATDGNCGTPARLLRFRSKFARARSRRKAERAPDSDLDELQGEVDDRVVLQRLTRLRDSDGRESLFGSLRADFDPGQRAAQIYVGFCPPFDGTPTIDVEQSDGPPARITVGHVLPHGARIDVRLAVEATTAAHVAVELFGCCPELSCTSNAVAL